MSCPAGLGDAAVVAFIAAPDTIGKKAQPRPAPRKILNFIGLQPALASARASSPMASRGWESIVALAEEPELQLLDELSLRLSSRRTSRINRRSTPSGGIAILLTEQMHSSRSPIMPMCWNRAASFIKARARISSMTRICMELISVLASSRGMNAEAQS